MVFNSFYSCWLESATLSQAQPPWVLLDFIHLVDISLSPPRTQFLIAPQYLLHRQTSLMNSLFPVAQTTTVVSYMIYFPYMPTGMVEKYSLGSTLKNGPNSTTCFVIPVLVRTKIIYCVYPVRVSLPHHRSMGMVLFCRKWHHVSLLRNLQCPVLLSEYNS